jgi:hypothetical protein
MPPYSRRLIGQSCVPNLQKSQSNRRVCFKFCSSINQAGETISLLSVYFITKSEEGYPVKEKKKEKKRKEKRKENKRREKKSIEKRVHR